MKRLTVLLIVGALLSLTNHAIAATRYCGTGSKANLTTVTHYVGAAWDRPGYRLMQTRKVWSATSHYYVCRP